MFTFILFHLFTLQALSQTISNPQTDYHTPYNFVEPFAPYDPTRASIFRYRQQQSVNLGSWFVQEQWMVPSVFECAAEPKIAEIDIANGGCNPQAILEKHWDTFITQEDFNYLASIGINTVRLPIGYWSLGPNFVQDTPFANVSSVYENAWPHVVRAINMAEASNIAVIVDLHGAPGSQNGQPHSGISDGKENLCTNSTYQEKTFQVIGYLASELCFVSNVAGIQLLNEPEDCSELANFYTLATNVVRNACSVPDFPVYLHDGFDLDRFENYVSAKAPDFSVQDHHSYFVYTPQDDAEPADNHTTDVQTTVTTQLASANDTLPHNLIVGEWSCALTPDSMKNESDPERARRNFCLAQYAAYTQDTPGNSFWSYKKEDCDPDWCFLNAVNNSLPSSFFFYGSGPITSEHYHLIQLLEPEVLILPSSQLVPRSTTHFPGEALSRYRHRSYTIAHRRQFSRDSTSPPTSALSSDTKNHQDGYQEGFVTAQKFALYGGSKLGFVGQYIWTGISGVGRSSQEAEETLYRQGFMQGLRDAEAKISGIVGQL
ncbi:glycoside hydrolase [Lentinula aciculospora]|uniref:Glycoside hydrolase n=1 Tax=Lentinula aciculospora TaxID=153920 RepID=A0A9W9DWA8_9AGAR|nr:glycoside hydrolase [Lentinula aciculospora]